MVVERIEQGKMQDRRDRPRLLEAHGASRDRILVGLRPAVRTGYDAHAVGPQRVELAHRAVEAHRLDIGVAADEKIGGDRFEQARPVLARIGTREQRRERMPVERLRALVHKKGERADILGHELDRAMHDRIGGKALARERRIVARRPPRAPRRFELDQPRRARGFLLGGAAQTFQAMEHGFVLRKRRRVFGIVSARSDAPPICLLDSESCPGRGAARSDAACILSRVPSAVRRAAMRRRTGTIPSDAHRFSGPRISAAPLRAAPRPGNVYSIYARKVICYVSHQRAITMSRNFFVYILTNRRNGTLYVGVTNDLTRRISEHKAKLVPGFTRKYNLDKLVYAEPYDSVIEARACEHSMKRWRRAWKIALIEKLNPDWHDLSSDWL